MEIRLSYIALTSPSKHPIFKIALVNDNTPIALAMVDKFYRQK